MEKKTLLWCADNHSGHIFGLTPPDNQLTDEYSHIKYGFPVGKIQRIMWKFFYQNTLGKKYDGFIHVGDPIDGKAYKDRGRELIETDLHEQVNMGENAFKHIEADNKLVIAGTRYHTDNDGERLDKVFARQIGAEFRDVGRIEIFGTKIKVRHHIGNTSTPVGGDITMRKKTVWDLVDCVENGKEIAHVHVFAHCHRFSHLETAAFNVVRLPALQGATGFGELKCDGVINFGYVEMDIYENGEIVIRKKLLKMNLIDRGYEKW